MKRLTNFKVEITLGSFINLSKVYKVENLIENVSPILDTLIEELGETIREALLNIGTDETHPLNISITEIDN